MGLFGLGGTKPSTAEVNAALLIIAKYREKLADAQTKPLKEKELKDGELEKSNTTAAALKAANKLLYKADQNTVDVFIAALRRKENQPTAEAESAATDEPISLDDVTVGVICTEADPEMAEDALANALTTPALTDSDFDVVEEPLAFSATITSKGPAIIDLDKAGLSFTLERKSGNVPSKGVKISVESLDGGKTIRICSDKPFQGIAAIKLPVCEKDAPSLTLIASLRLSYKA